MSVYNVDPLAAWRGRRHGERQEDNWQDNGRDQDGSLTAFWPNPDCDLTASWLAPDRRVTQSWLEKGQKHGEKQHLEAQNKFSAVKPKGPQSPCNLNSRPVHPIGQLHHNYPDYQEPKWPLAILNMLSANNLHQHYSRAPPSTKLWGGARQAWRKH